MVLPAGSGFAENETLVIGLGGHKCGSSWLAEYFREHSQCFVSYQKELDVFGSRHARHNNYRMRVRAQKIKDLITDSNRYCVDSEGNLDPAQYLKIEKIHENIFDLTQNIAAISGIGSYADIFRRRQPKQTHIFDISPYYSVVHEDILAEIYAQHSNVKIIMSMRDPVERFYSAYRYAKQLRGEPLPKLYWQRLKEQKKLHDDFLNGRAGDYERILTTLDKVVPRENVFLCFYEELFSAETIHKICDFLGVNFVPAAYDKRVHETVSEGEQIEMYARERTSLIKRFEHIYAFIEDRFGDKAPDLWNWPKNIRAKRAARRSG